MDTKTLIADAKARFNHNSAKAYLKEKYEAKLFVAEQGGLWKADQQTIAFLHASPAREVVIVDTFGNPVLVDPKSLVTKLGETYETVMLEWHTEWQELEGKR
jgi:hypothetical protein